MRAILLSPMLLAAGLAACARSEAPGNSGNLDLEVRTYGDAIVARTDSTVLIMGREHFAWQFGDRRTFPSAAIWHGASPGTPVPIAAAAEPAPLGSELPKSSTDYS